ncbi:hypothetical protein MIT9_P2481 [Methylomarinovum caldicuralii]|uniref:Iron-containing redox enzyme family protein n=1 Tax=Methylomarinovum caldicuralii TaxID=438856 RepID=A0AAU9C6S8_9GAMM|nr:iron-containing redox enzyme family protein [Methylomarinovum caldicuralii]BCX82890.1 hypothetical protein MIT9_P2481 [Methylomarinovum caldicuralii]
MTGWCANPLESWLDRLLAQAPEVDAETVLAQAAGSLQDAALCRRWQRWLAPLAAWEGGWLDGMATVASGGSEFGAALLRLQLSFPDAEERLPASGLWDDDLAWIRALAEGGSARTAVVLGMTLAHVELEGGVFGLGRPPRPRLRQAFGEALRLSGVSRRDKDFQAGRRFYRWRTWLWCRRWLGETTPQGRLLLRLRAKARYGRGFHAGVRIGGRCLDDWLAGELDSRFLQALRDSPVINCGRPQCSRLLRALDLGGPMFGVFDADDRRALEDWLAAGMPVAEPDIPALSLPSPPREWHPGPVVLDPPGLYHTLLDPRREARAAARRYVETVLARARRRHRGFAPAPGRLAAWLEAQYRHACEDLNAGPWPWLSRAACRWGIEQLAPAILVDGAWLQHSARLRRRWPAVGRPLWRIYRDELGDGAPARHHGNVYRRLLRQAGIDLADFRSEAFIHHPGFIRGAFDLPAFLLAVDAVAEDYLPEILGLNLAIEFSGLGRLYQRLAATLESHGFDVTIVRLHQSIDTLAGGHAALAREAVAAYLVAFESGGPAAVSSQWRRIASGWHALTIASRRFARHLLWGWFWRFGLPERLRFQGATLG